MASIATPEEYISHTAGVSGLESPSSASARRFRSFQRPLVSQLSTASTFASTDSFTSASPAGDVSILNKLKAALPNLKKVSVTLLQDVFSVKPHKSRQASVSAHGNSAGDSASNVNTVPDNQEADTQEDGPELSSNWQAKIAKALMKDRSSMKHKRVYKVFLLIAVLVGLFGSNTAALLIPKQYDAIIALVLLQSACILTLDTALWCYVRHGYVTSVVFWVDLMAILCVLLEVTWLLSLLLAFIDSLLPPALLSRTQYDRMQNGFRAVYQAGRLANIPRLLRLVVPELDSGYQMYRSVHNCCCNNAFSRYLGKKFSSDLSEETKKQANLFHLHQAPTEEPNLNSTSYGQEGILSTLRAASPLKPQESLLSTHRVGNPTQTQEAFLGAAAAVKESLTAPGPIHRFRRWSSTNRSNDPDTDRDQIHTQAFQQAGHDENQAGQSVNQEDTDGVPPQSMGDSLFNALGFNDVVAPWAEQVGTIILEHITARVVLMVLIINLLSSVMRTANPSTQKELGLAQLAAIAQTPGGFVGGTTFQAALSIFVMSEVDTNAYGTFYNEDEPLLYLRVGYNSVIEDYTDRELLSYRRDSELAYAVWDDECKKKLESGRIIEQLTDESMCFAAAIFDMREKIKDAAVFGLGLTFGMVMTIGLSLTLMAADLQRMLVQPINQGIAILQGILQDPTSLANMDFDPRQLPLHPGQGIPFLQKDPSTSLQVQSYVNEKGEISPEVAEAKNQLLNSARALTQPQAHGWLMNQIGDLMKVFERAERQLGIKTGVASETQQLNSHLAAVKPFLSALESIVDSAQLAENHGGVASESGPQRSTRSSALHDPGTSENGTPHGQGGASCSGQDLAVTNQRRHFHDGVLTTDALDQLGQGHSQSPFPTFSDGGGLALSPGASQMGGEVGSLSQSQHITPGNQHNSEAISLSICTLQDAIATDLQRAFPRDSPHGLVKLAAEVHQLQGQCPAHQQVPTTAGLAEYSHYMKAIEFVVHCRMNQLMDC